MNVNLQGMGGEGEYSTAKSRGERRQRGGRGKLLENGCRAQERKRAHIYKHKRNSTLLFLHYISSSSLGFLCVFICALVFLACVLFSLATIFCHRTSTQCDWQAIAALYLYGYCIELVRTEDICRLANTTDENTYLHVHIVHTREQGNNRYTMLVPIG